jgi:hypothetical protein
MLRVPETSDKSGFRRPARPLPPVVDQGYL